MAIRIHKRTLRRAVARRRRHLRIRRKIRGTAERPRLVVHRSSKHIEGQLVDDVRGVVLVGYHTKSKEFAQRLAAASESRSKTIRSGLAGRALAERARAMGIESVVFDRGGYRYHGRVKAFAEGAREGGLKF